MLAVCLRSWVALGLVSVVGWSMAAYSTALYGAIQCCMLRCQDIALYRTILYDLVRYCTMLHSCVRYCKIFHDFVRHGTILYPILQCCTLYDAAYDSAVRCGGLECGGDCGVLRWVQIAPDVLFP